MNILLESFPTLTLKADFIIVMIALEIDLKVRLLERRYVILMQLYKCLIIILSYKNLIVIKNNILFLLRIFP